MNTCNVHHLLQQYDYAVMLSAELDNANTLDNVERTSLLEHDLELNGVRYVRTLGCYKGVLEQSFLVFCDSYLNVARMLHKGLYTYQQESVLVLDNRKSMAMLHYVGSIQIIGRALVEVEKVQACVLDNYTIIDGTYWIVE